MKTSEDFLRDLMITDRIQSFTTADGQEHTKVVAEEDIAFVEELRKQIKKVSVVISSKKRELEKLQACLYEYTTFSWGRE